MKFSTSQALTLLSAAGYTFAAPAAPALGKRDLITIGYRVVDPAEAKILNDAGTIVDTNPPEPGERQLGDGFYTIADKNGWPPLDGEWYCIIKADSAAVDRVAKAWVPEWKWASEVDDESKVLWNEPERIDDYIKGLEDSWDPATTIRLAIIEGLSDQVQLLVPPKLYNGAGGAMGFTVECKENKDDISSDVVNYDDWQNNIKGNRTPRDDEVPPIIVGP